MAPYKLKYILSIRKPNFRQSYFAFDIIDHLYSDMLLSRLRPNPLRKVTHGISNLDFKKHNIIKLLKEGVFKDLFFLQLNFQFYILCNQLQLSPHIDQAGLKLNL